MDQQFCVIGLPALLLPVEVMSTRGLHRFPHGLLFCVVSNHVALVFVFVKVYLFLKTWQFFFLARIFRKNVVGSQAVQINLSRKYFKFNRKFLRWNVLSAIFLGS